MKIYARINKLTNIVENIEQFDDKNNPLEIDQHYFVESLVTNPAYIGGDYFENTFYKPQPYPSWTRGQNGHWISPTPRPEDTMEIWHEWDETKLQWISHEFEILNLESNNN
jgi:hypothetical protein